MTATIEQLVKVRSQLAEQLEYYLENLAKVFRAKSETLGPGAEQIVNDMHERLVELEAQASAVEHMPVFAWVELTRLATQDRKEPASAILNCLEEQFKLPSLLRSWVGDALPTSRCRLIVCRGNGKLNELERSKLVDLLETIDRQGWDVTGSRVLSDSLESPGGETMSLLQPKVLVRAWFAPFIVARKRNPDFVGREIILGKLRQALTRTGTITITQRRASLAFNGSSRHALAGLGGIGKTAVAVEYAYRFRSEHDAVFFVRADQPENLREDFEVICTELGLQPREYIPAEPGQTTKQIPTQKDLNPAVRAVLHWLDTNSNWLIVVDNVEDPREAGRFLPNSDNGHILITSRRQHLAEIGIRVSEPIVLDELSPEEAAELLWKHSGAKREIVPRDELQAAKELVNLLGGLPLALEQAAAMICDNYSVAEYLRLWRERRVALFEYEEALDAGHPESVVTTFALTFERIRQHAQQNPRHRQVPDLLKLMAFLSPDEIPFDLLIKGAPEAGSDFLEQADRVSQETQLKEWLSLPKSYSLIGVDTEKKLCRMHRLVQEVLRSAMKAEDRQTWAKRTIRALHRFCPILSIGHGHWMEALRVQSHAFAIASILQDPFRHDDFNFEEAADLLTKTGLLLTKLRRPEQGIPLFEKAMEIRGPDLNLKMAETLCYYADALEDSGKHEAARELYQQALNIRRQFLGERSDETGQIYNNLGLSYFNNWENAQAETYYQKARKIWEDCRDDVLIGCALHNLAMLHQRLRKPDTEHLFRQAAAKLETKDPHDEMVAQVWHNLGDHLVSKRKPEEGEHYLGQAQILLEKLFGKDSATLPQVIEDRADALEALARYAEAKELRARARKIRDQNE